MRDSLCNEAKCREGIEYHKEFVEENLEDIMNLKEDIRNCIQRYTKDNHKIIEETYLENVKFRISNIRAKYSLGDDVRTIEEDFLNALHDLENIGTTDLDYLSLLWMVSLGILLETDKQNIEQLAKIVKRNNINDFVIDFLLCASQIGYRQISNSFVKETPYSKIRELIELVQADKLEASKLLQTYMEKEWFQGHYDYEWKNAHKRAGYVGFWSFETAAIVKIFGLDDTSLKNNRHYPYDLVHYKNSMKFKFFSIDKYIEKAQEEVVDIVEGIENNPLLERVIPLKWHAFINDLIHDYQVMDDETFYEKYKHSIGLNQIWFFLEDYKEENKDRNMLGTLIVFALVVKESIYQLDYKVDLEDYQSFIKNEWNDENLKLVRFILNNDQQYYAYVPEDVRIEQMYEVGIQEV